MILLTLFIEFIKIGAFAFGGGFATLPFIYQLASKTQWISVEEINNMITISQMTPGPLGCNISTYVGFKLNGILGGIVATIAFVIPSIVLMCIINKILNKFKNNQKVKIVLKNIRATAFASILVSCMLIIKKAFFIKNSINWKTVILVIILSMVTKKIKIHPIFYMIFSGIIGIVFEFSI